MYAFAETYLVPLQLILAMVGMGATLSLKDFALIGKHPAGLTLGLALQLVFVPAIALAMINLLGMTPGWAVGLLLMAVIPGGATSNLFTFIARGSVPLSIAVTLSTTIICMASIPLMLTWLLPDFLPQGIEVPTERIARDIVLYLLLPLAAGMLVHRRWTAGSESFARWCIRGSLTLVVAIGVAAIGSGRMDVVAYGAGPPATIVAFGVIISLTAAQICRLARRYDDDTTALTIEVTVRNTGIGFLLVPFFFVDQPEQSQVLYTALFYAGLSGLLMLPTLLLQRFGYSPAIGWPARRRAPGPGAE